MKKTISFLTQDETKRLFTSLSLTAAGATNFGISEVASWKVCENALSALAAP